MTVYIEIYITIFSHTESSYVRKFEPSERKIADNNNNNRYKESAKTL